VPEADAPAANFFDVSPTQGTRRADAGRRA
jgi:hypothetical protein